MCVRTIINDELYAAEYRGRQKVVAYEKWMKDNIETKFFADDLSDCYQIVTNLDELSEETLNKLHQYSYEYLSNNSFSSCVKSSYCLITILDFHFSSRTSLSISDIAPLLTFLPTLSSNTIILSR